MSDPVKLLPYDSREALYRQLCDVTHLLGEKVMKGLGDVRKYPPAGLTRAFKAYATTVIELNRDRTGTAGTSDRKPVNSLSDEEFQAELAQLARHVVRSMPRAEVESLLAAGDEREYSAGDVTATREQGDDDE